MLAMVADHVCEMLLDEIPVNRFARPDELAGLVRFIASDDSCSMTEQIIGVDDGLT